MLTDPVVDLNVRIGKLVGERPQTGARRRHTLVEDSLHAEKRGIDICGYHCSQAVLAPKGYLTGAEWNWEKVYTDYVNTLKAGKKVPNLVRGGLKEQIVKTSPYGPAVSAEAQKTAEAAKAKLMEGSFAIFKGPLKDNTGKTVIAAGVAQKQTDVVLEQMNYLVEGVIGKV